MPVKNIIPGQKISPSKLQRARELRRDMTLEEKTLWHALRGNRLSGYHFRRQQIIAGYIVDFYCHSASLVVEVDGGIHLQQKEYDLNRDNILASMGLRIIRFSNEEVVRNLSGVFSTILKACQDGEGG